MQGITGRSTRARRAAVVRRAPLALLAAFAVTLAGPALAAKWHDCPGDPDPVYPSALGATNAPFAHPGHDLRITLNDGQAAASGGFALTPDGNRVEITIASLFGDPIPLAPRFAAATSGSSLTFTFPDTAAEVGRSLAGPAEVRVLRGETLVARIAASDLVALPPRTDVTALLMGLDPNQVVQAALGADGDVWIPASFHGKEMPMPGCPGDVMMPMQIEVGGADVMGVEAGRHAPLERMRRLSLYFGDFQMNGFSFYGALSPDRIALEHVAGSRGISLCQMNDVIDLVLRVKGNRAWSRSKRSPFASAVQDATPISLRLRGSKPLPESARASVLTDSFGSSCEVAPDVSPGGKPDQPPGLAPSVPQRPAPSPRR
ncbi:hypothetical protein K2Z84_28770 [Candidatus Binatia bacterium]|nr:hypothetical protein [Candidatus Binatia bacterium]